MTCATRSTEGLDLAQGRQCDDDLGALVEEPDRTYLAETDTDGALRSLQAASCTYRIALGPRAGQKVLSLQTLEKTRRGLAILLIFSSTRLQWMNRLTIA
jgi:hypothetical protein